MRRNAGSTQLTSGASTVTGRRCARRWTSRRRRSRSSAASRSMPSAKGAPPSPPRSSASPRASGPRSRPSCATTPSQAPPHRSRVSPDRRISSTGSALVFDAVINASDGTRPALIARLITSRVSGSARRSRSARCRRRARPRTTVATATTIAPTTARCGARTTATMPRPATTRTFLPIVVGRARPTRSSRPVNAPGHRIGFGSAASGRVRSRSRPRGRCRASLQAATTTHAAMRPITPGPASRVDASTPDRPGPTRSPLRWRPD